MSTHVRRTWSGLVGKGVGSSRSQKFVCRCMHAARCGIFDVTAVTATFGASSPTSLRVFHSPLPTAFEVTRQFRLQRIQHDFPACLILWSRKRTNTSAINLCTHSTPSKPNMCIVCIYRRPLTSKRLPYAVAEITTISANSLMSITTSIGRSQAGNLTPPSLLRSMATR